MQILQKFCRFVQYTLFILNMCYEIHIILLLNVTTIVYRLQNKYQTWYRTLRCIRGWWTTDEFYDEHYSQNTSCICRELYSTYSHTPSSRKLRKLPTTVPSMSPRTKQQLSELCGKLSKTTTTTTTTKRWWWQQPWDQRPVCPWCGTLSVLCMHHTVDGHHRNIVNSVPNKYKTMCVAERRYSQ